MRSISGFIVLILIIINSFTVYKFIFNQIFIDYDDFQESLRYLLTPDFISFFRGEYWKDRTAEFKFGFFVILCVMVTIVEYWIINGIIQAII